MSESKLMVATAVPLYEDEHELPDVPAVHVVEVDEEQTEPDPGGDVALQHDDTEEEAPEHGAQLGAAEQPGTELRSGPLYII